MMCPYCGSAEFATIDGMDAHAEECAEIMVKCPVCSGRGTQHLHGAAISGEEMAELGPEFLEDYMAGTYEHACDMCGGSKTVSRGDLLYEAESAAERRMGA